MERGTIHFEFGNRHRSAEFWARFENAGKAK
jgi:hypothetical protein